MHACLDCRQDLGIDAANSETPTDGYGTETSRPRPVEIMSERQVAGKRQYRVKYTDGKIYACDWVNRPLLDHYKSKQRIRHLPNLQTWPNQRYNYKHCC